MTRGTINVKLRPIKLAFLVNPNDKESLLKAIEINTFLWGGMYNPIIPTYKQISSKWKTFPYEKKLSAKNVVSGYLDNFDPDYVVPMGECIDYKLDIGHRTKIDDVSDILASIEETGVPNYGIGLFEVLNYLFQEEIRFQPRDTKDICIPRFGTPFRLFLASVFGKLPENIDTIFEENFAEPLEAKKADCSAINYTEFFDSQKLFLRRITEHDLKSTGRREHCTFLLDATKSLDIIDYWNLRAIGWNVLPVPKQFILYDKTKQPLLNFIENNYAAILKSRSISEDELQHFSDSLDIPLSDDRPGRVSPTWYPRIWDISQRKIDLAECCELEVNTAKHNVSTDREAIDFKTLDPEFMSRSGSPGKPRFANEIEWRLSDDRILFAEAIPEGDNEQASFIVESIGLRDEMRLFKKGVIYLACRSEQTLYLRSPHAEGVFTRWLESKGWTVKISSAGRVARKMLEQLQGIMGTWILAQEGIIKLLDKMNNNNEKSLSEEYVQSRIHKIANQAKLFSESKREGLPYHLIASKILQLGMKIQCPICTQYSWYSVRVADYDMLCPKCLDQFSFPSTSKKVKWSYRTIGPFSLPNQAHGAYTVLLTLRFFWKVTFSDSAMTPLLSFTAEKNGMEIETDLALFFQESNSRHSKMKLIFAECKTYNSFQKSDIDKMVDLGKTFPGAVLVFATLKESLSEKEKAIFRPVVKRFQKYKADNHSFNPVLILTKAELISELRFPHNWIEAGSIYTQFTEKVLLPNVSDLCDFTQQIYLDMEPWDQDLENDPEI